MPIDDWSRPDWREHAARINERLGKLGGVFTHIGVDACEIKVVKP